MVFKDQCLILNNFNNVFNWKVAFNMYDMDNDGVISKDELMAFLTLMVGNNVSQDQVTLLYKRFYKIVGK